MHFPSHLHSPSERQTKPLSACSATGTKHRICHSGGIIPYPISRHMSYQTRLHTQNSVRLHRLSFPDADEQNITDGGKLTSVCVPPSVEEQKKRGTKFSIWIFVRLFLYVHIFPYDMGTAEIQLGTEASVTTQSNKGKQKKAEVAFSIRQQPPLFKKCPERDSNPHSRLWPRDFKSLVSTIPPSGRPSYI